MDETFEVKLTATDLHTILKMANGCLIMCKGALNSNSIDDVQDNVGHLRDNIISLLNRLNSQLKEGEDENSDTNR